LQEAFQDRTNRIFLEKLTQQLEKSTATTRPASTRYCAYSSGVFLRLLEPITALIYNTENAA